MKTPIVQRKHVDSLNERDHLLMDAGLSVKAGQPADDKTAAFLLRHMCISAPVVQFSGSKEQLSDVISKLQGPFHSLRIRLVEKLKNAYTPYHESDSSFCVRGKKKQLTEGLLFEREPGPLYQPDIDAGSEQLLPPQDISYLQQELAGLYERLEKFTYRGPTQKATKRTMPRAHLESIRIGTQFQGDRVSFTGDTLAWHCVDVAIWFMVAMVNMNKERFERGVPFSETRFDPNSNTVITDEVRYRPEMIQSAALGILLHGIGFAHRDTQQLLYRLWHTYIEKGVAFDFERLTKTEQKTLQKQYFAARNLLRNRDDIPPVARMMVNLQLDYPDLTGYPSPYEHRFLHEFVRMFHIIDTYDDLINPIIPKPCAQKSDALRYITHVSGHYQFSAEGYQTVHRFDHELLKRWLHILAPYSNFELVKLFPEKTPATAEYAAQVYSYSNSHTPVFSLRQDHTRSYPFGSLLLSTEHGVVMSMKDNTVVGRKRIPGSEDFRIQEPAIISTPPEDNPLYSSKRPLSRGTHSL